MYILIAILIFGFLIFIHELGHYTFARIFKVGIKEFAIGMGPKLFSRVSSKTGIAYSLRLLPIGGFVSMVGEDEESDDESALTNKPVWQRAIIMAMGGIWNILLGVILMITISITATSFGSNVIAEFSDGARTEALGLKVGDEIVSVGGMGTHVSYDLSYAIMRKGAEKTDVEVIRDGERLTVKDVEFPTETESGMVIGIPDFKVYGERKTFGTVMKHSLYESVTSMRMIWESLIDLVRGRVGIDQMSGPVGVTQAMGDAAKSGIRSLLLFTALIALNLGIFNLIPFPALDGGRIFFLIVFYIIEKLTGKKVSGEAEGYIHFAGLALLLLLMVVITFKDITKLFV